jgi:hypothetical protein
MINNQKFLHWLEISSVILIAMAILLLPVTTQPQLHLLMRYALVSPPSLVVVALVGIIWLPNYFLRRGKLPVEAKPFLAFIVVAIISSLVAFFYKMPPYRSVTILSAEIDAFLTLAIASGVFIVFAVWFREIKHLRLAALMINLGGLILILWSLAQLYVILARGGGYFGWMVRIQFWLSKKSLLDHVYMDRVGGFAFEPSWLAHQLNVLYIPFWFAATVTGYSSIRKIWRISLENILLVLAIIVMFFSFSRIGVLAFFFMAGYAAWRLQNYLVGSVQKRAGITLPVWARGLVNLGLVIVYAAIVFGVLWLMARFDNRIADIFKLDGIPADIFTLAFKINLAERVVYWANGLLVFAQYPVLGVGLGNVGFFFKQNFPVIANRLNEILYVVTFENYLPNVKSIWMRILGETGLVGFSLFCTWLFVLWKAGKALGKQQETLLRLFGWMGLFVIIAFTAEGFSIDSYALPYLWVSLGLVTAASAIARKSWQPK